MTTRPRRSHVLGGGVRYAAYFLRLTEDEIGWTRTADHAGDDPVAALARTSGGLRKEFAAAPDAGALVAHRFADLSVSDLLALRVFELLVPAHDLHSTTWHSSEARRLTIWVLDNGRGGVETMRSFDVLTRALPTGPDADPRARLVAFAGRTPQDDQIADRWPAPPGNPM